MNFGNLHLSKSLFIFLSSGMCCQTCSKCFFMLLISVESVVMSLSLCLIILSFFPHITLPGGLSILLVFWKNQFLVLLIFVFWFSFLSFIDLLYSPLFSLVSVSFVLLFLVSYGGKMKLLIWNHSYFPM